MKMKKKVSKSFEKGRKAAEEARKEHQRGGRFPSLIQAMIDYDPTGKDFEDGWYSVLGECEFGG